jgi:nitrite reductase/ring-hydroxylating ferredoxin subunit
VPGGGPLGESELPRVAVYRRGVAASLERVWENVLDWEHLPWLHADSFSRIERLDSGDWGWRARVGLQPASAGQEVLLELRVDREAGCYEVHTREGPGRGTRILTRLERAKADETRVTVEFRVPGVAPESRAQVGSAFTALYTRLWDEDEQMMRHREAELARRRAAPPPGTEPVSLGTLAALRSRLPLRVEAWGRSYRVLELEGQLVVHATACPHWLGPLEATQPADGCITCPWHGYRFDLRSGRSADGRGLRLGPTPRLELDPVTQEVRLWPPSR